MMNRRQFLHLAAGGAAGLVTGGLGSLVNLQPAAARTKPDPKFVPDLDIALKATPGEVHILPGNPTSVWHYQGQLLKGDRANLIHLERSYLGPIIRVHRGQKIRIRFTNNIPAETIVHWHGLHVPALMDGHPRLVIPRAKPIFTNSKFATEPGPTGTILIPMAEPGTRYTVGWPGSSWFQTTKKNQRSCPAANTTSRWSSRIVPLTTTTSSFTSPGIPWNGCPVFLGDRILINGQPDFILQAATRPYRLRILNGSNSRIYRLAWQDGSPMTLIGTDGGLLEKPIYRRYVMLGPGERVELWADFSRYAVGTETALISLPFDAGMMGGGRMGRGMMGGMMGSGTVLPNGAGFSVLRIKVNRREKAGQTLQQRLSTIERYRTEEAVNQGYPKIFELLMRHMAWTINGRTFQMKAVAPDERVKMNSMEIWEFVNRSGGMGMMGMMQMPHPIHLHGKQFQVLERQGVMHEGYVDEGWEDTVLLMPGERIRILVRFGDYPGLFLYHCHNLEHEDMGMMRNYFVEGAGASA